MKKLVFAAVAAAMFASGVPAYAGVHLLLDIFPPPPASPPGLNDGPPVNERALDVRSERVGKTQKQLDDAARAKRKTKE